MKYLKLIDIAEPSPFTLWRSSPADTLGPRKANHIRRALRGFQLFGEPGWKASVHGDAAAAIGIAIRLAVKKPCTEPIVDLVMSAVLAAAVEGDATARTFLAHVLLKRAAFDPAAKNLAASWTESKRAAVRSERPTKPEPRMRPPRNRRVRSCAAATGQR